VNIKAILSGTATATALIAIATIIGAVIGIAGGSVFIWAIDRI
jgi:hypothetical protein